jgi:uncharacterized protein YxeA
MKKTLIALMVGILCIACAITKPTNKSVNNYIERKSSGVIKNRNIFDSILSVATNKKIDSSKPIVVIYYPGKDKCNSTGAATRKSRKEWYDEMERGINKISKSNVRYIYKDTFGLYGKNDGYKNWYKDPKNLIEKLFFEKHYPCASFVIISKNGSYISSFGEFPKELVWKVSIALEKIEFNTKQY